MRSTALFFGPKSTPDRHILHREEEGEEPATTRPGAERRRDDEDASYRELLIQGAGRPRRRRTRREARPRRQAGAAETPPPSEPRAAAEDGRHHRAGAEEEGRRRRRGGAGTPRTPLLSGTQAVPHDAKLRARTTSSSPTVGTATPTPSTTGSEDLSEDPDEYDYLNYVGALEQPALSELDDDLFFDGRRWRWTTIIPMNDGQLRNTVLCSRMPVEMDPKT
ncbi:hypothetical protein U9M48_016124 [Paspalum notatum var. saurae]|uniref:Uncharacterized protein n=1 Tax=Paspalum notatum var. saurae TaxID=547442 RepID=A0AAQ3T5S2_PASNO